jgi:hypothetical protein
MVISYNQNLHFKIHCKNSTNNIIIHFIIFWYYKNFTQWYEHKIHCKSLCFFVLLKTWIQNYSKIPCFVETKSKQQIKFVVYQNKISGFFITKIPIAPLTLLQIVCLWIPFLFPRFCFFGQSQITSSWFKTNKNSKFKLIMFHE